MDSKLAIDSGQVAVVDSSRKVVYRLPGYRRVMPKDLDDASRLYVVSIVQGWIDAGKTKAEIARALDVTKPTVAAIVERDEAGLKVARADGR